MKNAKVCKNRNTTKSNHTNKFKSYYCSLITVIDIFNLKNFLLDKKNMFILKNNDCTEKQCHCIF